ncbi:MAG TPA: alpha,alpha-trehalase TreF [Chitinophagaceae bacterium]
MKKTTLILIVLLSSGIIPAQTNVETPDQVYGELFRDVQMSKIFPDGKTFVDCIPKRDPKDIVKDYLAIKKNPAIKFSLELFVKENFELPPAPPTVNYVQQEKDVVMHIKNLWGALRREPDKKIEGSSLLPLPYSYIVPGGRFREIYYWDSYFTMLGLKENGETDMIENMIKNFAYLIETYGHIPNGNRSYYIGRSQPPFFAAMVQLLATIKGDNVYVTFLPALEKEYKFWMDGASKLKVGQAHRRVVRLKDGAILNRYWDDSNVPRQESWKEDLETAAKSKRNKIEMYKHLRAGAESGIDFSNRWFADGKNLTSIQVTNYIAVDLNALLTNLEYAISKGYQVNRNDSLANEYRKKAEKRRVAIDKYCWNSRLNYYCDYNFKTQRILSEVTPAGMYPFCFFESKPDYLSLQARKAAEAIKSQLLQAGGVTTTKNNTGQQWDSPNGWAPLTWMTIWGLDRCGQKELAKDIAMRWMKLNMDVYARTGKLMEKYNVVDTHLEAGGGEYPGQDGFGWTNGVLLALITKYGKPE